MKRLSAALAALSLASGCAAIYGASSKSTATRTEEVERGRRPDMRLEKGEGFAVKSAGIKGDAQGYTVKSAAVEYRCREIVTVETRSFQRTERSAEWTVYTDFVLGTALAGGAAALAASGAKKPDYTSTAGNYSPHDAAVGNAAWLGAGGLGFLISGVYGATQTVDDPWEPDGTYSVERPGNEKICTGNAGTIRAALRIGAVDLPLRQSGADWRIDAKALQSLPRIDAPWRVVLERGGERVDAGTFAWTDQLLDTFVADETLRQARTGNLDDMADWARRVAPALERPVTQKAFVTAAAAPQKAEPMLAAALVLPPTSAAPLLREAERPLRASKDIAVWRTAVEGWARVSGYRPAPETITALLAMFQASSDLDLGLYAWHAFGKNAAVKSEIEGLLESAFTGALVVAAHDGASRRRIDQLDEAAAILARQDEWARVAGEHPGMEPFGTLTATDPAPPAAAWYRFAAANPASPYAVTAAARYGASLGAGSGAVDWLKLMSIGNETQQRTAADALHAFAVNDLETGDLAAGLAAFRSPKGSLAYDAVTAWMAPLANPAPAENALAAWPASHVLHEPVAAQQTLAESFATLQGPGTENADDRDGADADRERLTWLSRIRPLALATGRAIPLDVYALALVYRFNDKPCDKLAAPAAGACRRNLSEFHRIGEGAMRDIVFGVSFDARLQFGDGGRREIVPHTNSALLCPEERNCLRGAGKPSDPYLFVGPVDTRAQAKRMSVNWDMRRLLAAVVTTTILDDYNTPVELIVNGILPVGRRLSTSAVFAGGAAELTFTMKTCASPPAEWVVTAGAKFEKIPISNRFYCEIEPRSLVIDGAAVPL